MVDVLIGGALYYQCVGVDVEVGEECGGQVVGKDLEGGANVLASASRWVRLVNCATI